MLLFPYELVHSCRMESHRRAHEVMVAVTALHDASEKESAAKIEAVNEERANI